MKYVMEWEPQIKFGKEWLNVGVFRQYHLSENPTPRIEQITIHNFSALKKLAKENSQMRIGRSFFRKKEYVEFSYAITCGDTRLYEKDFRNGKELEMRIIWKSYNPTMSWLLENLSAENFVEYAKDRSWNNINLITSN